ncbi:MAG: hypothetical protein KF763_16605 [Cyclobacteriaceae bacterium]|nr:hypothetical protein [Cyclobacteriaceae bacterium]
MRTLIIFICLTLYIAPLQACDICGCGAANYYWGIMPQFHKSFVGLRYRTQSFNSHLGLHPSFATTEFFQTTEVWGRYYISPRLQVVSFLPYHINQQNTTTETKYLYGVGDIPILTNYKVFSTEEDFLRRTQHQVWVGGGIKLPTGRYRFTDDATQVANPNFQLGTGSVDFMLNSWYTVRQGRFGLTTDATLRLATTNPQQYQFGHRINGSVSAFYVQQIKRLGIMPHTGLFGETAKRNRSNGVEIADTGGSAVFLTAGSEGYVGAFTFGISYQKPVQQLLADGHIQAHDRVVVHVTWMF